MSRAWTCLPLTLSLAPADAGRGDLAGSLHGQGIARLVRAPSPREAKRSGESEPVPARYKGQGEGRWNPHLGYLSSTPLCACKMVSTSRTFLSRWIRASAVRAAWLAGSRRRTSLYASTAVGDATDLFRGPGRRLDCARPSYDDAGARFTRRQKVRGIGAACKPDAVYDRRMKPRIYVDTSVIGGCEDDEFAEHSV